jgi:hypothetical protein
MTNLPILAVRAAASFFLFRPNRLRKATVLTKTALFTAAFAVSVFYAGNAFVARELHADDMSEGRFLAYSIHGSDLFRSAVSDHLISNGPVNRQTGILGQAPCEPIDSCDPCEPVESCEPCEPASFTAPSIGAAWVNYIGRWDRIGSTYTGFGGKRWQIQTNGVQAGSDLFRTQKNQFGVLFGFEKGQADNTSFTTRRDNLKSEDYYFGLYGTHVFRSGADGRILVNYGWQSYDQSRWDGLRNNYALSSFDGNTLEVTTELGKRYWVNPRSSFRPVFGFDAYFNDLDGERETLTGYSFSKTSLTQTFVRAGSDFRWSSKRLTLNSSVYYSYDIRGEHADGGVRSNGVPLSLVGQSLSRNNLNYNLGAAFKFRNGLTVFSTYQGVARLDEANGDGLQHNLVFGGAVQW